MNGEGGEGLNLEYSQVDGYVNARIEGTSDEVAALVLALQERRTKQVDIQFDGAINRLAKVLRQAKDDTVPEVPEK